MRKRKNHRWAGAAAALTLCALLLSGCAPADAPASSAPSVATTTGEVTTVTTTATTIATTEADQTTTATASTPTPTPTKPTQPVTTTTAATTTAATTTTATESTTSTPQLLSITFSVDCHTAVAKGNRVAQMVSQDGMILAPTVMELEPGATVYDALRSSGLVVASQSTALGVYVSAIQSLGTNACGAQSGWLYTVNGQVTGKSCSLYTLQNGDVVRWVYTCENGKDI